MDGWMEKRLNSTGLTVVKKWIVWCDGWEGSGMNDIDYATRKWNGWWNWKFGRLSSVVASLPDYYSFLPRSFFFFLIKKNRKETEEHQELILRSPLSSHLPSPPYLPIHLLSPPPPLPWPFLYTGIYLKFISPLHGENWWDCGNAPFVEFLKFAYVYCLKTLGTLNFINSVLHDHYYYKKKKKTYIKTNYSFVSLIWKNVFIGGDCRLPTPAHLWSL